MVVDLNLYSDDDIDIMHSYMAAMMHFSSHYGRNLDALYDELTDICEETDICINIYNGESEYLLKLIEVFKAAEEENNRIRVNICVR